MFGYVTINKETLSAEEYQRFRAQYCGLCHVLAQRYGKVGRAVLSYDMAFLSVLLASLYEPEERAGEERCGARPAKPHAYVFSEATEYAADMNVALAYHVCADHAKDDKSASARAQMKLLAKPYARVKELHPETCAAIESRIAAIAEIERDPAAGLDAPANETGRLLGAVYAWKDDLWAPTLGDMGAAPGRFIYVMDAYDDLEGDLHHGRYNPLRELSKQEDFEELIRQSLMLVMGECTREFELLPLIRDVDILRNILYGGCWGRYQLKQQKREKDKPAVKRQGRQEGGA